MVRVARPIDELYSLEFPAYQPGNTAAASKSILDKVFDKSPIELNSHTVQRLGRVPGQTLKDSVDIFITLIPDDTQTFELDCVEAPIRVHERLFHELVERGDITDGATLSAYAHLLARQGLLTAQAASPLFDRRRTPLRIKPRSEG